MPPTALAGLEVPAPTETPPAVGTPSPTLGAGAFVVTSVATGPSAESDGTSPSPGPSRLDVYVFCTHSYEHIYVFPCSAIADHMSSCYDASTCEPFHTESCLCRARLIMLCNIAGELSQGDNAYCMLQRAVCQEAQLLHRQPPHLQHLLRPHLLPPHLLLPHLLPTHLLPCLLQQPQKLHQSLV